MAIVNADSTPMRASLAGHKDYRQLRANAVNAQNEHGSDMDGSWVGPYPPREMMDKLMPISEGDLALLPKKVKFNLPVRKGKQPLEKHIYQLFERTIRKFKISPKFKFFIGADGRPKGGDVQVPYRPDGGVTEMTPSAAQPPDHGHNLRPRKGQDATSTMPVLPAYKAFNWFEDGLVIEFKKSSTMDPFYSMEKLKKMGAATEGVNKPRVSFPKLKGRETRVRGQLAIYAKEVFDHQHRTHAFQLLVCGRHARIVFWDHSGAIVSDSFNYVQKPQMMAEFFWRYNHMDRAARGWDASVKVADDREKDMFKAKLEQFIKDMNDPNNSQRRLPRAEETLDPAFPIYKVTVIDDTSGKVEDVLIQRPFFRIHSVLGRATRGYIAYLLSDNSLKFLKDTWRVVHDRLTAERTLCHTLDQAGVRNVPQGVFGGDVTANGERDGTHGLEWAVDQKLSVLYTNVRLFRHHRFLEELAYPVDGAPNSYELVAAFRDCLRAIQEAKEKLELLHRDISIGNVMLRDGENCAGVLADWDHAATIEALKSAYQNFRTGTWQFMSIGLLGDPNKGHDILDDLESVFWSLLYAALHYFDHTKTPESRLDMKMFDEQDSIQLFDGKTMYIGGSKKLVALGGISKWVTFASPSLDRLIGRLAKELHDYYSDQQKLPKPKQNVPAAAEPRGKAKRVVKKACVDTAIVPAPALEVSNEEETEEALTAKFQARRAKLCEASFWLGIFNNALREEEWYDDALGEDRYPSHTEAEGTQQIAEGNMLSHVTGEELAAQDLPRATNLEPASEEDRVRAIIAAAQALEEANMESDNDDRLESCASGEEDDEDEDDSLDEEYPPVSPSEGPSHHPISQPSSPISTSIPGIPPPPPYIVPRSPHNFPRSSYTVYSLRSEGSSRLKRSIHEVTAASPVEEPGDAGLPPPKKSRSRSRAKAQAAPTDWRTRSSSKKSTVTARKDHDEEDDAADADTEDTKEARPKRGLRTARSGELNTVQPRREGLRPRPSRRTLFRST